MNKLLLVTLVHNRKSLLGSAIKSVLSQNLSLNKFDYLLFNNGSNDGSEKIVSIASKRYKNIHAYHSDKNLGQQGAYNFILDRIIPEKFPNHSVLCVLDDDDCLVPNALSSVYKFFSKNTRIGASYSGFSIINDHGHIKVADHGKAKMVPVQFTKKGQLILRRLFISNNVCGHFRCYRISALKSVGGFPTDREYATDYCMFGRIMEKYPVVKIDKVLYQFRQHRFGQIESKKSPQQTADWHYYMTYFKKRWTEMGII